MSKRSEAANVIDLEAFRQRKMRDADAKANESVMPALVTYPVWFCWVPVWAPVFQ